MTESTQHSESETRPPLQPLLHDLVSCVAAPGLLLAAADGQVRPGGVSGWYVGDDRLVDTLEIAVDGSDLDLVRSATIGASRQEFSYVARGLGDPLPDPTVRLDRFRTVSGDHVGERIVVASAAQEPVDVVVRLTAGTDLLAMPAVKGGTTGPRVPAIPAEGGLRWADGDLEVVVSAEPAPEVDAGRGVLAWRFRLERGDSREVVVTARTATEPQFPAGRPAVRPIAVEAPDIRLRRTAEQSLADLEGLALADDGDRFLAAGSPWYLTLFGRDSLWAARMLIPVDASLALSTLRVLARRQGTRDDPATEEQPGKILHEVRSARAAAAHSLPPVYYGTVDATPLFVCTLADAHAWGADPDQVRALLPAVRGCLTWQLAQSADTGWIRYVDHTGSGLANQGWKDSHDSVQFADGRLADPPIALCEVQAYAYDAAVRGAALLGAFGEEPVPGLVEWAADLRSRFTRQFWVGSPSEGHVAIALDRDGRPVDSVTSNMGHLLGTGLLDDGATSRVASVLADRRLDSGFGLRTLAADSPRFSRLSYHGGTVWPHDTAIAIRGLAADGHLDEAASLARGLFVAAEGVDYRLPELYAGDAAADVPFPAAYPASCRPQAWSAAAPLAALVAITGLRVDVPAGTVTHPARTSTLLGAFSLRGLRVGAEGLDVHVAADGEVRVELEPGSALTVSDPGGR